MSTVAPYQVPFCTLFFARVRVSWQSAHGAQNVHAKQSWHLVPAERHLSKELNALNVLTQFLLKTVLRRFDVFMVHELCHIDFDWHRYACKGMMPRRLEGALLIHAVVAR